MRLVSICFLNILPTISTVQANKNTNNLKMLSMKAWIFQEHIHKCLNQRLGANRHPQCLNFANAAIMCHANGLIGKVTFEKCKVIETTTDEKVHNEAMVRLEKIFGPPKVSF